MFKRTKIELTFEVDLSMSPGFGYDPDKTDYRTSVEWIDKANKDYERENAE